MLAMVGGYLPAGEAGYLPALLLLLTKNYDGWRQQKLVTCLRSH